MPKIPFDCQWSIDENQLLSMKNSTRRFLQSNYVTNIPEFEYFLKIYPNDSDTRGQTRIYLHLYFKNVKMVEVDCTFTIESANDFSTLQHIYKESKGCGPYICKATEFFDPEKKYIVDGKFTVKVSGMFCYGNDEAAIQQKQQWDGGEMGDELWAKDATKDFTIISDGKEIKVHKFILQNRSYFFATMINTCSNDTNFELNDFSLVETALKLIYHCSCTTSLSLDELMSLLQFFDEDQLPVLKAKVESHLIAQISVLNVIRLTNFSILTNSQQLKRQCMEFLMTSFASKTSLADIKDLNKDIALQILELSLNQAVVVERVDTPENEQQQKWKGGELGDELWKNDDTKDITIVVGGKEIKAHKLILSCRSEVFNAYMNEAAENKLFITGYPFNVVETAVKMIYNCNFTSTLSMHDLKLLLWFFEEYNLPTLKAKVEPYLIAQISASTVIRLTNASVLTNSTTLKEKCIEFLMTCFASKIAVNDIRILDKSVALQVLENSLYNIVQTCN